MQGLCFFAGWFQNTRLCIIFATLNIPKIIMKLITHLLLLLSLVSIQASAQDSTLIVSQPIELSKEGINQVLQLSNGNTMLFHFENKRHIRVKVFDSTGKEIASAVPELKIVDMNLLDITYKNGLIECSGDAALFLTQDINNAQTLMRIVFDGNTGRLKKEEIAVESASFKNKTRVQLLAKPDGSYSLVCFNDNPDDDSVSLVVKRFNTKHQEYEALTYKQKKSPKHFYGAVSSTTPKGDLMVSLLDIEDGNIGEIRMSIQLMYLRNDLHDFVVRSFKMPDNVQLEGITFTRNEFAGNLNVVLVLVNKMRALNGLNTNYYRKEEQLLMIMPEDMSSVNMTAFSAVKDIDSVTNLNSSFGMVGLRTNERGVTIAVHADKDPQLKYNGIVWDIFKRFIVSKYDDNGKQIAAVSVPCYHKYSKDATAGVFNRMIDKKTVFMFDKVVMDNSVYLLYNDIPQNENATKQNEVTVVTDFENTDAVLCHISKKNVLTKKWLIGKTDPSEHLQVVTTSAHYHESRKMYSTLVRKRKGKEETYHMVWRRMVD